MNKGNDQTHAACKSQLNIISSHVAVAIDYFQGRAGAISCSFSFSSAGENCVPGNLRSETALDDNRGTHTSRAEMEISSKGLKRV